MYSYHCEFTKTVYNSWDYIHGMLGPLAVVGVNDIMGQTIHYQLHGGLVV